MELNEHVRRYVFEQWRNHNITAFAERHGINRNALSAYAKGKNNTMHFDAIAPILGDMARDGFDLNKLAKGE